MYWEDQPEDETNKKHIENGRDGVHQSIDNNLKQKSLNIEREDDER